MAATAGGVRPGRKAILGIEPTAGTRGNASFLVRWPPPAAAGEDTAVFTETSAKLCAIVVVVAQSVRASVCGTEGRGFESRQPPSCFSLRGIADESVCLSPLVRCGD